MNSTKKENQSASNAPDVRAWAVTKVKIFFDNNRKFAQNLYHLLEDVLHGRQEPVPFYHEYPRLEDVYPGLVARATPEQRAWYAKKMLNALSKEVKLTLYDNQGRLSHDQVNRLCMYKREMKEIEPLLAQIYTKDAGTLPASN